MRKSVVLLLLLGASVSVTAQGTPRRRGGAGLKALVDEVRRIESNRRRLHMRKQERREIFEAIAALRTESAARELCGFARSPLHHDLMSRILLLLAENFHDSQAASDLFRLHVKRNDPHRGLAREYLIAWFSRRHDEGWLNEFFKRGDASDRFWALRALGDLGSATALVHAEKLLSDPHWTAVAGSPYRCGALALAIRRFEGARAARFLILLQRDPRWSKEDAEDLKAATRLWKEPRLVHHVRMNVLADTDPLKRAAMVAFMGEAGIEASRAPLVFIARRRNEPVQVRVAAIESLGGLKIARGAMAETLRPFLDNPDVRIRKAAVHGLARLRVRRAAALLVERLGGDLDAEIRKTLAKCEDRKPGLDWKAWIEDPACTLPEGT